MGAPEQTLAEINEYLSPIFQELSRSGLQVSNPAFAIGVLVSRLEGFERERQFLQAKIAALTSENKHLEFRVQNLSGSLNREARQLEKQQAQAAINSGAHRPNQWSPPVKKEAFV